MASDRIPDHAAGDLAYLGLTKQVVTENTNGQPQRTYRYDAAGKRLSQVKKDADGSNVRNR